MKNLNIICTILGLIIMNLNIQNCEGQCMPVDLKCEYHTNPLGIDVKQPRLSWRLEDSRRGASQTAYRIKVASDGNLLTQGQPDLWDSGKIASDRTNAIRYAGKPLQSRTPYYWNIEVWDKDGKPSGPSTTTSFETAFLDGLR